MKLPLANTFSMTTPPNVYQLLSSLYILVWTSRRLSGVLGISQVEIEGHLELGRQLLSKGQYADALSHYHAAVEGDPENYLTYFKRATVYLALGKSKPALEDLNEVIALKPDFLAARHQRGSVLLKQGYLDEAHIDFEWVLRLDPHNAEAHRAYTVIEPLKQDISLAQRLMGEQNHMGAIEVLNRVVQECPWDVVLREMRATCYENLGDINNAINDLRPTTKMVSDNTVGHMKLSKLYYKLGDAEESLNTIRECLKLDPDHKDCFAHYKKVKKLVAQLKSIQDLVTESRFEDCIEKAKAALRTEPDVAPIVQTVKGRMCHCHRKAGNTAEAITICTDAIRLFPEDVRAHCDRAEAYLAEEQYDDAMQDFQKAANLDEHSCGPEGVRKAQRLQKQAGRRDYYKILGVKRTATKKEVLKAYRKLAQKWHPDNFQDEKKKEAEKKFIDIASAKEVLTDPEKRKRFDNGEDPLDPESQQGQGFNPFQHGFHPFGGGGGSGGSFTYKFVFN
ncbi:dnaJ homolog subfamily C member 3-like [Ornithodoros turicata]